MPKQKESTPKKKKSASEQPGFTKNPAAAPKKKSKKLVYAVFGLCGCIFICLLCSAVIGAFVWWRGQKDDTLYTKAPNVDILEPTGANWYSTTTESIKLSGIAFDEEGKIKNIEWEMEDGTNGSATGTDNWTIESIKLKEGDNKVTVKVYDESGEVGEDSIFIAYNKEVLFLGNIKMTPDNIFKGDPDKDITFSAKVTTQSNNPLEEVTLFETDENGEIVKQVGKMVDNGKVAEGDDIPSDGTYSLKKPYKTDKVESIYFRATAKIKQSDVTGQSAVSKLMVVEHASQQTIDEIDGLNQQVQDLANQLQQQGNNNQQVANQVNTFVGNQPGIAANGISQQGQGVWWVYENTCIPGGILLNPPNTKGGEGDGELKEISLNNNLFGEVNAQGTGPKVKNTKAIYLGPYIDQFGQTDDYYGAWEKIKESKCPKCETTEKKGSEVTVEDFKNLDKYGLIVVSSHGDNWYGGQFAGAGEICKEGLAQSQVVILTGQPLTKENLPKYEADLMARRLAVVSDGTLAVLPAFISHYNSGFPNSLVYIATCRSSYNNTMASAFLGSGADVYYGFDDYVLSSYCFDAGIQLFDNFLLQGDTASTSFNDTVGAVGSSDGQGADFLWTGESTLTMGGGEFTNTGFEEGALSGWGAGGDARIITSLGSIKPTKGNFMTIISTGLGSVEESKSNIAQDICFDSKKATLKFDYNLVSEEPTEYLGSSFDDRMNVYIVVNGASTKILTKGVNDSKWNKIAGIDFEGGDSTTYTTGWKSFSYSLSGVPSGAQLELKFEVVDVGDSAFDTAALIDNIRIE